MKSIFRPSVGVNNSLTEDPDVGSFDYAEVGTEVIITALSREFHDVSPSPKHDDTSNDLSWLGVPSEGFTAYVYSAQGRGPQVFSPTCPVSS